MGFDLAAQIDLDARLARDRALGAGELATRDERLGDGLAGDGPAARLAAWLDRVYAGTPRPGDRFVAAQRRVRAIVWLAGLLFGIAAAAALLRYDGSVPINVVNVLAGLVGLQIAILATLVVHLALARGRPLLHEGVRRALGLERFVVLDPTAERWLVVRLTQGFGVAFNAGALLAMWYLVTFTDLAFSWSTTLGVEPAAFKKATEALCAPFAWIAPAVCPDDAVVAATQYFRQGARYAGGVVKPDPAVVGAWWPFLVGCVAFYGLLPRLTLWVVAQVRVRQAVARPRLDALEVQALLGRLERRPAAAAANEVAALAPQTLPAFAEATLIAWRDMPWSEQAMIEHAKQKFSCTVASVHRAGSVHGQLDGKMSIVGAALVYTELTTDFDKATARFVAGLRQTVGPRTPILLVPVETRTDVPADPKKLALWRSDVARAGDP